MPGVQSVTLLSGPVSVTRVARQAGGSLFLNAVCPWLANQVLILSYMGVDVAGLRARLMGRGRPAPRLAPD